MPARAPSPLELTARQLCRAADQDPDAVVAVPGKPHGMPGWCAWRTAARARLAAAAAADTAWTCQDRDAPLAVRGRHDGATIAQMRACLRTGRAVGGALCADGHPGHAQPVGGVVAYDGQVSISGVGMDIGCGNLAVRLSLSYGDIAARTEEILEQIGRTIAFGIARPPGERADHALFDDDAAWQASGMADYRDKARAQLGTVGGGNHYVDLLVDETGLVWIGVHFGSGLGNNAARRYLDAAGGRDAVRAAPVVLDVDAELGQRYLAAMHLADRYAQAGRDWVVSRIQRILGGEILDTVHNHHNFAWRETHAVNGAVRDLWVVRKGATPAFPGQRCFVGGSMGDDAVILEGRDTPAAGALFHSTIHGAGRTLPRSAAKTALSQAEMRHWLRRRHVAVAGGGLDESPMAYRRLHDVLAAHDDTIRILHVLRPFAVAMAGANEADPFKD